MLIIFFIILFNYLIRYFDFAQYDGRKDKLSLSTRCIERIEKRLFIRHSERSRRIQFDIIHIDNIIVDGIIRIAYYPVRWEGEKSKKKVADFC